MTAGDAAGLYVFFLVFVAAVVGVRFASPAGADDRQTICHTGRLGAAGREEQLVSGYSRVHSALVRACCAPVCVLANAFPEIWDMLACFLLHICVFREILSECISFEPPACCTSPCVRSKVRTSGML